MSFVKTLPAAFASILLGAHFLRAGNSVVVLYCVALLISCFIRRPRLRAVVRASLALGVVVWLVTAMQIVAAKTAAGLPAGRSLAILLGVATFTAVALWLLPPIDGAEPDDSGQEKG